MPTIRVQTKGLQELGQVFRRLADDMQKKTARAAVRAGAVVIQKAARDKAPVATGVLKKAIQVQRSRRDSTPLGNEVWRVGVNSIARKYADTAYNRRKSRVGKKYHVAGPAYYWRFAEFGTVHESARPFMRPAFDQNKEAAAAAIVDTLRKGIGAAS